MDVLLVSIKRIKQRRYRIIVSGVRGYVGNRENVDREKENRMNTACRI